MDDKASKAAVEIELDHSSEHNFWSGIQMDILYSRELDATLERVRGAGGKIVKATFDFPGGRRFHFADPSGNELGVWSEK